MLPAAAGRPRLLLTLANGAKEVAVLSSIFFALGKFLKSQSP